MKIVIHLIYFFLTASTSNLHAMRRKEKRINNNISNNNSNNRKTNGIKNHDGEIQDDHNHHHLLNDHPTTSLSTPSHTSNQDKALPESPTLVRVKTWYTVAKQGVSC